jgi:hypothetical protein
MQLKFEIPFFKSPNLEVEQYTSSYFDILKSEYYALQENLQLRNTSLDKLIQSTSERVSLSDIFKFEKTLFAIMPENALRNNAWHIRFRYKKYAAKEMYDSYLQSSPPDPHNCDIEALRQDLLSVISSIQNIQINNIMRERLRNRIFLYNIAYSLLILIGIVLLVYAAFLGGNKSNWSFLIIVFIAGFVGGLLSSQDRLQNAVDIEITPVALGKTTILRLVFGVLLASISGGIFAIILYFMFAGKLLEGALFPSPDECLIFPQAFFVDDKYCFVNQSHLLISLSKILVWSFLAGFLEKFVPDHLFFMISQKQATNGK